MFFDGNLYKFVFVKYGQIYTQIQCFPILQFLFRYYNIAINVTTFCYNSIVSIDLMILFVTFNCYLFLKKINGENKNDK